MPERDPGPVGRHVRDTVPRRTGVLDELVVVTPIRVHRVHLAATWISGARVIRPLLEEDPVAVSRVHEVAEIETGIGPVFERADGVRIGPVRAHDEQAVSTVLHAEVQDLAAVGWT